jgi:hypothetical protein
MAAVKRILCLANSRKLHGRCIAGRELLDGEPGPWIRPVSDREHEEVSEYERQYEDGSDPRVLDIIDIALVAPRANSIQPENWLLDPEMYWTRVGRLSTSALDRFVDRPGTLWLNGFSTYSGCNDQIPVDQATGVDGSLKLVRVDALGINVSARGGVFGRIKRRVQGRFQWQGVDYWLWITDPWVERDYLARADGDFDIGPCFLTISLAEPFNGACYKLIAAVITDDPKSDAK